MMRTLKWHCPRTREQQLLPPNPPSIDYCLRIYLGPPASLLPPNPLAAHCLRTPLPAYCIRVRLRTHTKLLLPPNSIGSGHTLIGSVHWTRLLHLRKCGQDWLPPHPLLVSRDTMGTTGIPSQTISPPQPTDLPVISPSSPSATALCNSLRVADTSVTESISNIRSFIHSSTQIAAARNLRGKDAQGFIDLIDQVNCAQSQHDCTRGTERGIQALTLPELNGNLRKQYLHLLYKVCKACELLPASYVLPKELVIYVGGIPSCGGFADVSEGEYLGRRVAIKHLRFGTKDKLDKIFKVPRLYPRWPIVAHFAHSGFAGKL